MTTMLAFILGILLKVVADDVLDLLVWTACKVLSSAARLDARFTGEAELLFHEWDERMQALPGKIAKLCFALGLFFGVALVHRIERAYAAALACITRTAANVQWHNVAGFSFMALIVTAIMGIGAMITWLLASIPGAHFLDIPVGSIAAGTATFLYALRIVGGLLLGSRRPFALWVRERQGSAW